MVVRIKANGIGKVIADISQGQYSPTLEKVPQPDPWYKTAWNETGSFFGESWRYWFPLPKDNPVTKPQISLVKPSEKIPQISHIPWYIFWRA